MFQVLFACSVIINAIYFMPIVAVGLHVCKTLLNLL